MFERRSDGWIETETLSRADGNADDDFGDSVALASDGDTALISGGNVGKQSTKSGDAFVFTRGSDGWSEATTLDAGVGEDQVGLSVAISDDGETALLEGEGGGFVFDV